MEQQPLLRRSCTPHRSTLSYFHVSLPRNPLPRNPTIKQRLLSPSGYPRALRLRGSVIPRLILPLIFFSIWATFLAILRHVLAQRGLVWGTDVSGQLIMSLGLVVGLILAFRTNSAYQCFRDGRQTICDIQTSLRSLRLLFTRVEASSVDNCTHALSLLPAFLISVTKYLRLSFPSGLEPEPSATMTSFANMLNGIEEEIKTVPLVLIDKLFDLANEHADGRAMGEVRELVQAFTNLERIIDTPIPSAYDIHLNQVITLYILLFPLQISAYWLSIPATIFAAFTLFGVEAIGQEIENPFGFDWNDLPMDEYVESFAEEVEYNIKQVQRKKYSSSQQSLAQSGETLLLEVQK